ncbi:hypothetical protein BASA50_003786 [Batrachochytrium salamandrivorans]|uniref:ER-derived vesicles protein ERV14 n=1 Tax=Batrachochytrium salamandrivorans TaxID=1357716 RepID=A0ABQ8FKI8_9FUNG|nr:hypothetical protein BASA60_005567 [Batrachochytrium salamandrivorans]KAH6574880.1 hypothetical protein BASA62_002245 [Batrachochytrium salamandrivorans]KAH6583961.1 hypothetical protein BASA61_007723 [Batrachochytrium salamandrivorans]KAH6598365.1 hypothetical protein BASA50_003786 [Batrachochytrium salamandrivorans]KAH9271736.1 hypothetical protein BASA83_006106 [Batrachochytrium salamandrivorans]
MLLFLFALVMSAILLFGMVFFIILFSDLEADYINPIDLCNKLNQFVIPEHLAHAVLWVLFLITGNWVAMLINTPLLVWHAYQISNNRHMYDATEIFRTIGAHKLESFLKLAFYLVTFFYYLYRMIESLISSPAPNVGH